MAKDFSPEEKLLRLIRSKSPSPAQADAKKENVSPEPWRPAPVSATVKAAAPISKPKYPRQEKYLKSRMTLSLDNINLILVILLTAVLVYFIPNLFKRPKTVVQKLEEKIRTQGPVQETKPLEEEKRPPVDYIAGQTGARNIFQPIIKEEAAAQAPAEQGPKLEDIKAQLNLLGVVWGDNPQAIIEDKKAQKTYFLSKGQGFNDIEVKDIFENKVILSYQGQQFELTL